MFIVLTGMLFYFGNMVARKSNPATASSEQSARFLDIVAVLDTIQFDLDFINSFGNATINTDAYVEPISNISNDGRDNPFMKSNPYTAFGDLNTTPNTIPTDFDAIPEGYTEEYQDDIGYEEEYIEENNEEIADTTPLPQPPEEQNPEPSENQEYITPESSATLTR